MTLAHDMHSLGMFVRPNEKKSRRPLHADTVLTCMTGFSLADPDLNANV